MNKKGITKNSGKMLLLMKTGKFKKELDVMDWEHL